MFRFLPKRGASITVRTEDATTEAKPVFEVFADGRSYRIWADGHTEGFGGKSLVVINRIPAHVAQAVTRYRTSRS